MPYPHRDVPATWPAQRPLAVPISIMLEGWADDTAPGIGPMGNPLKAGVLDRQAISWAEYGAKVGAWRILDLLDRHQARAVFYVSGVVAERYPDLLAAIVQQGHVVAGHSWSQHMIPAYLSEAEERQDIARCTEVLTQASGSRPMGWISPRCTPSQSTAQLLAEAGYAWHADTFDSDVPYVLDTPAGPITAMPFTMEINDMPLSVRYGNEPQAYTRALARVLDNWGLLGTPACLDMTLHAHVYGRPAGAIEFIHAIDLVRRHEQVAWLTHHAELSDMMATQVR